MHHQHLHTTLLTLLLVTGFVSACAEDVPDIDRTQPNRTLKSELSGQWYMLETVTDAPPTTRATFEGETSKLEKIVWQIEENWLLAYRTYPLIPGGDDVDADTDDDSGDADQEAEPTRWPEVDQPVGGYGAPVAAFRIVKHFDVVREYNSSTGEQTNVLVENDWDRPWFERDYMRVDWSRNHITNFDFISGWFPEPLEASYVQDAERVEARSLYWERDDEGELVYFDLPRRLLLEPNLYGCIISLPWYGWDTQDCAPAEVEIVTSFARTRPRRDYEPLVYDDRNMSRFGYFRTERYVHDPQRGLLESARQELINRHDIWQASYERDAEGEWVLDANGRRIPIPLSEREVRTVPYYVSRTFPSDDLVMQAAFDSVEAWDRHAREAVALVKDVEPDRVPDVFVLCHNPVQEGDHEACGEAGRVVRVGDLRHSTLHWVEASQLEGPLGYGPSATDPETGEIISGRAFVYGEGINTYAAYGLDVIRFINGDLDPELLVELEHARADVRRRAFEAAGTEHSKELYDVPLGSERVRPRERFARREARRESEELRRFDRQLVDARMQKAKSSGLGAMLSGDEYLSAVAARLGTPRAQLSAEDLARTDPTTWMSPTHMKEFQRMRQRAMRHSVDYMDMLDGHVVGIAQAYAGRTDYEQIWRELRAEVFRATALHEIGHTVGLRHNFQGTYDALNYHNEYWDLRLPTLFEPDSMGDLFDLSQQSQAQIDGRMREYQYSSIMDYGYTFNTDLQGLGRYDRAALVFGYSGGSVARDDATCEGIDRVRGPDGSCRVRAQGYVEVFSKPRGELGDAGEILSGSEELGLRYDDPTRPIVPYLERWHYTTVMQSFPNVRDVFDREWMRIDDVVATRDGSDAERIRVPYLFCSDEWVGALLSCQAFDAGADPFEMTRTVVDNYRSYYYFHNFKRDRLGWDPFMTLYREFFYTFLPLSDYYQNWYLAPSGLDPVMDDYWWLAVNASVNLFGEVIATPPYGTYCTKPDGSLYNLADEPGLGPETSSEYFLVTYCDRDAPFYEVEQGQGRRRFTAYDVDAGYNYADLPLEAGHYWTTLAAFWALIDPEAYVLGTDADAGVFAISFYDFFDQEIDQLVNAVMTESYADYSPVIEVTDESGENRTGRLVHQPLRRIYDSQTQSYYDPLTGADTATMLGPSRSRTGVCQPCDESSDCNGYSGGFYGDVFCADIEALGGKYCIQDCFEDASLCGPGETCDAQGWCVPEGGGSCEEHQPACATDQPHGACPESETCVEGTCEAIWPTVETDATFALADDMLFYGMLYSTFNFSTRYNDQINVFRMGTDETQEPGPGFDVVSFTDPISGHEYGALVEGCDAAPTGGATGLCEPCEEHAECAGYSGEFGGVYCQALTQGGATHCLVDCTDGPAACPTGYSCNAQQNCVPDSGSCMGETAACSPISPLGHCPDGATCVDGECEPMQSARCRHDQDTLSGGARMVLRGQELAERYDETLEAYWSDDGSDPQRETELFWHHSRARFELETHIDKLNTVRAVFSIFGQVY